MCASPEGDRMRQGLCSRGTRLGDAEASREFSKVLPRAEAPWTCLRDCIVPREVQCDRDFKMTATQGVDKSLVSILNTQG